MRNTYLLIFVLLILAAGFLFVDASLSRKHPNPIPSRLPISVKPSVTPVIDFPRVTIIAEKLDTPWAIAFLPDKSMLVTERKGTVRFIDSYGTLDKKPVATIAAVREIGEGGLMGITLHPNFAKNNFVYLYYTYNGAGGNTLNRVVRMEYKNKALSNELIIVDKIPGSSNHNGGRIKFGPDNNLYIGTGDAEQPSQAQNTSSLAGKILRVTAEGNPAPGNPGIFASDRSFDKRIYTYGHRNVQGLAWDTTGQLWATEHGPSGSQTGNDEVNKITIANNYGWPIIQGNQKREGMQTPILTSGSSTTWAPSGLAFLQDTLYFAGLRGEALYVYHIKTSTLEIKVRNQFGRLRDVVVGPDNMLYITTSNRDGRGTPEAVDDRIIRVNPAKL